MLRALKVLADSGAVDTKLGREDVHGGAGLVGRHELVDLGWRGGVEQCGSEAEPVEPPLVR